MPALNRNNDSNNKNANSPAPRTMGRRPGPAYAAVGSNVSERNTTSILSTNRIAQESAKNLNLEDAPAKLIHRNLIYPNPLNKKYMANITEDMFHILKMSILSEGLMHNLVVLDDGHGKFRLISGEKRWQSISRMTEEEYKGAFPNGVFAKVIDYNPMMDKIDEHIMLLTCNVVTFSNGSPDAEQLRDLIKLYDKKGYDKKEIVDYLGAYFTQSKQTIYKLISEAHAISELIKLSDEERMSRAALQCLGGLPEKEQKKIYERILLEEIDKVDQETAQRLKRELKSKDSESGSSTNLKSNSFVKYEKNLKSITDSVDKNKKVKKETMYEMELDLIESKLDNLIALLKEEKNALLAIKAKKENK